MGDYNPLPSPWHPSNPRSWILESECWRQAEHAIQEIIQRIQPTSISEHRRMAVVEYVQKLIRGLLGNEVLPFGSVPLKTYLPDGDIDLTALGVPNSEDTLASDVRSALEVEEQNKDTEFEVKDVQYIHAEVRLVKCLVQNIVVDISFNQIGGLSTLCFLEQVDRHIGKDNLFKRSIMLIKAWCYYESRILGAHHGLISTYALETLVLYIFHLFHSSLDGPLAVLYRFLDYYSKFDWDNYCISLHGPISISSLPELVAEEPENDGGDLLLSKEFLRNCVDMFSERGLENNSRSFSQKHLNIVDPLKENNNLGRSVSKGNFYRIRSAFTYGARKLGRILSLSPESVADEIDLFFMNTLDRHGNGERPDVQDGYRSCPDSTFMNHNGVGSVPSESKVEKNRKYKLISGTPTTDPHGALRDEINNIKISGVDKEHGIWQLRGYPSNQNLDANRQDNFTKAESNGLMEWNISGRRLVGDARDLSTTRSSGSRTAHETRKTSPPNIETCASSSGKAHQAPHLFFRPENGIANGVSGTPNEEISQLVRPYPYETESSTGIRPWYSHHGTPAAAGSVDGSMASKWDTYRSEFPPLADCLLAGNERIGTNGSPKSNHLADLSGDYDTHFRSLLYAQSCREYLLGSLLPIHRPFPSHNRNKYSWDAVRRRNIYTHMNPNGAVPGPPLPPPGCYPINPPLISSAYGLEDMPKPRGTGTYFPNANYLAYKERQPPGKGRNPDPENQLPKSRNNDQLETAPETSLVEKGNQDPPSQECGKSVLLEIPKSLAAVLKGFPHANGFLSHSDGKGEHGSCASVVSGASSPEVGKRLDSVSSNSHGYGTGIPASTVQRLATSSNPERPKQTYQLKNDDDFPPLTG